MNSRRSVLVTCVLAASLLGAAPASATARPNLVVPSVTVTAPATVVTGGTFKVSARIRNTGAATARGSRYAVLLSLDSVRNAGDRTVATGSTPRLPAGRATSVARTVTVPTRIASHTYRVLVCADATKVVAESHEGDNCRAAAAKVTMAPDADADGVSDASDCAPDDPSLPPANHPTVSPCYHDVYSLNSLGGPAWVRLDNVIVEAVDAANDRAFVQVKLGDAGYQGAANSAVEVSTAAVSTVIAVGDRVTVAGMAVAGTHGMVVSAEKLDVVGAGELVPAFVVSPADLLTHTSQYDALLVELDNQTIGTVANGAWAMAGTSAYDVTPTLTTLPAASDGASVTSLVGIADTYDASPEIWPRDTSDVTLAP